MTVLQFRELGSDLALESVSAVNMKTSGRNFGTAAMMLMMMMMMAVNAEVALSKEDPVA